MLARPLALTPDEAPNQRNWHYPANFEGTVGAGGKKKKSKGGSANPSGDRWERARSVRSSTDSYGTYPPGGTAATDDDVPEWGRDYGSKRRSSRNSRTRKDSAGSGSSAGWGNSGSGSTPDRPAAQKNRNPDAVFQHEF